MPLKAQPKEDPKPPETGPSEDDKKKKAAQDAAANDAVTPKQDGGEKPKPKKKEPGKVAKYMGEKMDRAQKALSSADTNYQEVKLCVMFAELGLAFNKGIASLIGYCQKKAAENEQNRTIEASGDAKDEPDDPTADGTEPEPGANENAYADELPPEMTSGQEGVPDVDLDSMDHEMDASTDLGAEGASLSTHESADLTASQQSADAEVTADSTMELDVKEVDTPDLDASSMNPSPPG